MKTPNVLHFASNKYFDFETVEHYYEIYKNVKLVKPSNLTILVVDTSTEEKYSLKQLTDNGIEYVNAYTGELGEWNDLHRLIYLKNALKNVITPYTLIIDTFDTVILDFEEIIDKFLVHNNDILFCAAPSYKNGDTNADTPSNSIELGLYRYLNAGCIIGHTDKLAAFFDFNYEGELQDLQLIINEKLALTEYSFENGQPINIDTDECIFSYRTLGDERRIEDLIFLVRNGFDGDILKQFSFDLDKKVIYISVPSQQICLLSDYEIFHLGLTETIDKMKIGETYSPSPLDIYIKIR